MNAAEGCSFCGQQQTDLLRCSRCKNTFYCSKICQKKHWKKGHKEMCKTACSQDLKSSNDMCHYCNSESNHLKKCTGCEKVLYCSKDCQTKDWTQRHKHECKGISHTEDLKSRHIVPDRVLQEVVDSDGDEFKPILLETCPVCGISCKLKFCQRCLKQKYCSSQCQKSDWGEHKKNCTKRETSTYLRDGEKEITCPEAICAYCKNKYVTVSCMGCRSIYYCTKSCQTLDWNKHKISCKSQRPQTKATETLSTADCFRLGFVTPEEHRGMNRNDGDYPVSEEERHIYESYLCSKCRKNKITVDCPLCTSSLYCSTTCMALDREEHQKFCYFAQPLVHNKALFGMSPTISFGKGRFNMGYSPGHAKFPVGKNPTLFQDGADLGMVTERTGRSREKASLTILSKYPNHTLILRIREIPIEEKSMFATNICRQPLVFLSYIRRFHRYRGRHNVYLQDADRREIYVSFYLPNDDPTPYFRWSDVVPGKFIAILFPCIHFFTDGTVGIRVDKASHVTCLDVED
ncbi:uncharacterized protein LOC111126427 [Crassostrea virginica]